MKKNIFKRVLATVVTASMLTSMSSASELKNRTDIPKTGSKDVDAWIDKNFDPEGQWNWQMKSGDGKYVFFITKDGKQFFSMLKLPKASDGNEYITYNYAGSSIFNTDNEYFSPEDMGDADGKRHDILSDRDFSSFNNTASNNHKVLTLLPYAENFLKKAPRTKAELKRISESKYINAKLNFLKKPGVEIPKDIENIIPGYKKPIKMPYIAGTRYVGISDNEFYTHSREFEKKYGRSFTTAPDEFSIATVSSWTPKLTQKEFNEAKRRMTSQYFTIRYAKSRHRYQYDFGDNGNTWVKKNEIYANMNIAKLEGIDYKSFNINGVDYCILPDGYSYIDSKENKVKILPYYAANMFDENNTNGKGSLNGNFGKIKRKQEEATLNNPCLKDVQISKQFLLEVVGMDIINTMGREGRHYDVMMAGFYGMYHDVKYKSFMRTF